MNSSGLVWISSGIIRNSSKTRPELDLAAVSRHTVCGDRTVSAVQSLLGMFLCQNSEHPITAKVRAAALLHSELSYLEKFCQFLQFRRKPLVEPGAVSETVNH